VLQQTLDNLLALTPEMFGLRGRENLFGKDVAVIGIRLDLGGGQAKLFLVADNDRSFARRIQARKAMAT